MTNDQIVITIIIFLALVLFISGRYRYDLVAFLTLTIAVISGLVSPADAFSGFAHPATITVALVLIVSSALTKSGSLEVITKLISPFGKFYFLHVTIVSLIAAILSMFMNNVGALALMMPVAIESAKRANRSPGKILMPLAFGSILGGIVTLIGTPPNIIVSGYRAKTYGVEFGMFDFTKVGGVIALVSILFLPILSWLVFRSKEQEDSDELADFEIESYISEVVVSEDSNLIGKTLKELEDELKDIDVLIVSLIRNKQKYYVPPKTQEFKKNDILLIEGGHDDIDKFISIYKLDMTGEQGKKQDILHSAETETIEAVVTPTSKISGMTLKQIKFNKNYNLNLLGVSRQGKPYRGRLHEFRVRIGDVLLLHGENEILVDTIKDVGCLPLAERGLAFGRRHKGIWALLIFLISITISVLGICPIYVSLALAVVSLVLLDIIPVKELYEAVEWPVIILLASMLPIGVALETTGTTSFLADNFLNLTNGFDIIIILTLVLVITMFLSDVLNNAATAILMAPIANSIAIATNSNPDTFLMAVAIGASCAFLTPIGHQNNALVMGPGGYKFRDYWKLGFPLEIIIVLVAIPMLLYAWPL